MQDTPFKYKFSVDIENPNTKHTQFSRTLQ